MNGCLRALLIHKGTKLQVVPVMASECLRALLIHKGTKPLRGLTCTVTV